ncbi:MAG TPA: ATP-binding protein [Candidatus Omnitrophica bacterium]|nr:ATP-binding protein [Candidatus Omnitrophota bacterium]
MDIELFYLQNPWQKGRMPRFLFIERDIIPDLVRWLEEKETLVVIGPRQAGKSTLLKALIKFLLEKRKIKGKDIFYFNLDDARIIKFLSTPEDFVKFIQSFSSSKAYIFIDEAQRLTNPGLFLKCIYDLGLNFKLIISGSSSLELKSKIFESLTGRKIVFRLFPFNFREFLRTKPSFEFKKISSWDDLIFQDKVYSSFLNKCLEEYVTYGGYPRVVLEKDLVKKKELLWEIYSSYVEKDVVNFLKIELPDKYNNLVKVLSSQIGSLVNIHELSNTLRLNRLTVEKYISALKSTFIVSLIPPFYKNIRSEISKMPKVYFNDPGLRNSIIDSFSEVGVRPDRGQLLENFVYTQLNLSKFLKNIRFWRTKTGGEIDFVAEVGEGIICFESKFSSFTKPSFSRSMRHFIKDYKPKKIIIWTKDYLPRVKEKDLDLIFLPSYWIFSLEDILKL